MAQSPSEYFNNPASGTTFFGRLWSGCIPNSGTFWEAHVVAWTGPNGTGSPVAVSSLTVTQRNFSTGVATNTVTRNGVSSVFGSSSNGTNGSNIFRIECSYTGGAIGSLEIYSVFTGQFYTPSISSLSTWQAGPGNSISIFGNHLVDTASVDFNGTPASFFWNSMTQITATVPAGASVGPVHVTNPTGTATSPGNFVPFAVPAISSFSPAVGPPGSSVTLSGSGFTGTTSVDFNGVGASFVVNSDSSITATVPNGATIGRIHVTNPAGTATSASDFIPGQFYWGDASGNGAVHNVVAIWYGDPSNNGVPHKAAGVWVPMNPDGSGGVRRIF